MIHHGTAAERRAAYIAIVTAVRCGIRGSDMIGKSRKDEHVRARRIAIYLTHEIGKFSLNDIGRMFGNRDHSTIHTSIGDIGRQAADDDVLRADLEEIMAIVKKLET